MINKNYVKNFSCEKDLSKYVDSMLFDSGEHIAHIEYEDDKGNKLNIDLMICGEVKITIGDNVYDSPREFPESLKEYIKNHPNNWDCTYKDAYIVNNNWFEFIYSHNGYTDGIVFEGDLSEYSNEQLKMEMIDLIDYIINGL